MRKNKGVLTQGGHFVLGFKEEEPLMYLRKSGYLIFLVLFYGICGLAAEEPQYVGRDVARKYFKNTTHTKDIKPEGDHYLAIHFGRHLGSEVWDWNGTENNLDLAQGTMGVTYRISEWNQLADYNLRVDFNEYHVGSERYYKISFLPLVTFPDAASQFPLYFGLGGGVGVFFRQSPGESSLSFDYQLIAGARFFNVYNSVGFFFEGGLKNHLLLLSNGQLNATFATLGTVFTF